MELLEDVGHPKPLNELLTGAFVTYRASPWIADYQVSP